MLLFEELGDVLWYVSMIAELLGQPLNNIGTQNLKKLEARNKK